MSGKRRGHGEGTIYERTFTSKDGKRTTTRWYAQMSVGDGSRAGAYFDTKEDARRWLTATIRDKDRGILPAPEQQTVAAFLASWLEGKQATLRSPRTYDRYEEFVRLHIVPTLGRVKLTALTPQQVQRLYSTKLAERDAKGEPKYSPTTVHHLHTVLHTALKSAMRQGLVQRNVCELVDKPLMPRKRTMQVWTPEQVHAFLDAAAEDRLYALFVLALNTGMRASELFGLRWADVDLDARDGATLQVTTAVQRSRSAGTRMAEPKTATGRRRIPLSREAAEALRAHKVAQLEERMALGPVWRKSDLVFTDTTGGALRGNNLGTRKFYPLIAKAGVPRIRPHDMRHTAASLLLSRGMPVVEVSELLGHADPATTWRFYAHVVPGNQRHAADVMDSILGRPSRLRNS